MAKRDPTHNVQQKILPIFLPHQHILQKQKKRNSLAVQWLGLRAFTAEGPDSIPGRGTKIPQALRCGQTKQNKQTKNQKTPQMRIRKLLT